MLTVWDPRGFTHEVQMQPGTPHGMNYFVGCEDGTDFIVYIAHRQLSDMQYDIYRRTTDFEHEERLEISYSIPVHCATCAGFAMLGPKCNTCDSTGLVAGEVRLSIVIPPHLRDGQRIIYKGRGERTLFGEARDLYVCLWIAESEKSTNVSSSASPNAGTASQANRRFLEF